MHTGSSYVSDPKPKNKKVVWLHYLILFFVTASMAFSGYLWWQTQQLNQQKTQLMEAIEAQKRTLLELQKKEQIGPRMKAAELLNKAKKYRTNWSELVIDLETLLDERSKIVLKSVNVNSDNELQIQAHAPDLLSAASLLVLIQRSERFENAFIQQVSPQGDNGNQSYNFSATFDYRPSTKPASNPDTES